MDDEEQNESSPKDNHRAAGAVATTTKTTMKTTTITNLATFKRNFPEIFRNAHEGEEEENQTPLETTQRTTTTTPMTTTRQTKILDEATFENIERKIKQTLQTAENTEEDTTTSETGNEATCLSISSYPTSDESSSDIEIRTTQYLLAEIQSAPKHILNCHGAIEQKLTQVASAFAGQQQQQKEQQQQEQEEKLHSGEDEPGCSRKIIIRSSAPMAEGAETAFTLNMKDLTRKSSSSTASKIIQQQQQQIHGTLDDGLAMPASSGKQMDSRISMEGNEVEPTPAPSVRSLGSLVCRICHNSENPERLVSPCLCKGSLSYVHIHCLERWISTSRSTICELCQFQYNTEQTLRYTCIQSLRMWYSRSMSRRALQEDCQMFSLLTLVAFGIIGTLLVGIQYYFIQGRNWGLSSMWTKGWLLFFLFTTLLVYFINIYMIVRSQLAPWYRWWQSARDIKLILENRKPFKILPGRRVQRTPRQQLAIAMGEQQPQEQQQQQQGASYAAQPQAQQPLSQNPVTSPMAMPPPPPPPLPLTPMPVRPSTCATIAGLNKSTTAAGAAASCCYAVNVSSSLLSQEDEGDEEEAFAAANFRKDSSRLAPPSLSPSHPMTTTMAKPKIVDAIATSISIPSAAAAEFGSAAAAAALRYHNELQISLELTGTSTELIEIPLEDYEARAFEYEGMV